MASERALWIAVTALLAGCGGALRNGNPEFAFVAAVEAHVGGDHARSADAAHAFLSTAGADDSRLDRAALILAENLERMGLTHAAALRYLDVAASRRDVELVDRAVAGLERIVERGPHDRFTIVEGLLGRGEITGLAPERAAFVAYLQGVESARQGQNAWADEAFARIPEDSPYAFRAKYVVAVRAIADGRWPQARELLDHLLSQEDLPDDVATDARLALARMTLEEGDPEGAVTHYEEVRRLAPRRPGLLLEMAWAHYYRGDSRRTLGLLVALDAPVFRGLIAPERFLLEALSLRRLCQFEPAHFAAIRLEERYRAALEDLHAGLAPHESEAIRQAARVRERDPASAIRHLSQLRVERRLAEGRAPSNELRTHLLEVYDWAIADAERRERDELREAARVLAEELVGAEDGVRIVVHELSVALLRGRRRPEGLREAPEVATPAAGHAVAYRFDGEFWTDEIDSLVVSMPDRCLDRGP